jgi:hypothetical protein
MKKVILLISLPPEQTPHQEQGSYLREQGLQWTDRDQKESVDQLATNNVFFALLHPLPSSRIQSNQTSSSGNLPCNSIFKVT